MSKKIPKLIWTFWNSATLPTTVDNCIKTWEFLNPDHKIIILNTKNLNKFIPEAKIMKLRHGKESFARLSDFIRLNVLYKYGGIWLDASSICTVSFDSWIERVTKGKKNVEFIGFYNDKFTSKPKYKVIESWCFFCVKNSKFVKKWRDEFMLLEEYETVEDYLIEVEEDLGVDFQRIPEFDDPDYLAIHISAQKVLQFDKYDQKGMVFINADKTALKHLLQEPTTFKKSVEKLCKDYSEWAEYPIIKFIGATRAVLDKNEKIRTCVFENWMLEIMQKYTGIEL